MVSVAAKAFDEVEDDKIEIWGCYPLREERPRGAHFICSLGVPHTDGESTAAKRVQVQTSVIIHRK